MEAAVEKVAGQVDDDLRLAADHALEASEDLARQLIERSAQDRGVTSRLRIAAAVG